MATEGSYHPDQEQRALADALDEALADLLPLARLHGSVEETDETWAALEALGVFSIGLGEAEGGSGLGVVEEALITLALGQRLASPAVLATLAAMPALRACGEAGESAMPHVAAAYGSKHGLVVVEADGATLALVRDGGGAAIHRADSARGPVDERHWTARLQRGTPSNASLAEFRGEALLRLRLLDAAALAGLAEAATVMAVEYAKMREQFGRPIGSFQAVKHACADMAIAARCARDQVGFAATALDQGRADAALQVESAFHVAGTAALKNAGANIQVHGGIGFSDEADPHLLIKRAQLLVTLAGGLEASVERLADLPQMEAA